MVTARAVTVERSLMLPHPFGVCILDGECEGATFALDREPSRIGETVEVRFNPEDQFATIISYPEECED